jgi:hypothetical protein
MELQTRPLSAATFEPISHCVAIILLVLLFCQTAIFVKAVQTNELYITQGNLIAIGPYAQCKFLVRPDGMFDLSNNTYSVYAVSRLASSGAKSADVPIKIEGAAIQTR